MAPPSQAGKFKPRKPGKKIQVGASSAGVDAADTTTTAASRRTTSTTRTGGRNQRGRSGSGRGRGRRRSPMQQQPMPRGDVYFGNTEAAAAAAATTSSTAATDAAASSSTKIKSTTRRKREAANAKAMSASEEIVVGQLDEGIGSQFEPPVEVADDKATAKIKQEEDDAQQSLEEGNQAKAKEGEKTTKATADDQSFFETYDSNTSDEEQETRERPRRSHGSSLPPTQLPFPLASVPVGIGGEERPLMYSCQQGESSDEPESVPSSSRPSPFVDTRQPQSRRAEEDSWFLFQFPTRLPPLKQATVTPTAAAKSNGPDVVTSSAGGHLHPPAGWSSAEVATSATSAQGFDNALSRAPAGKLGKLVVHKSGKTVLVMGGGDTGTPEIRMNVNEGLSCGFVQQAVAVDVEAGNYTPLGEVKKTVVVTPDVDSATN